MFSDLSIGSKITAAPDDESYWRQFDVAQFHESLLSRLTISHPGSTYSLRQLAQLHWNAKRRRSEEAPRRHYLTIGPGCTARTDSEWDGQKVGEVDFGTSALDYKAKAAVVRLRVEKEAERLLRTRRLFDICDGSEPMENSRRLAASFGFYKELYFTGRRSVRQLRSTTEASRGHRANTNVPLPSSSTPKPAGGDGRWKYAVFSNCPAAGRALGEGVEC